MQGIVWLKEPVIIVFHMYRGKKSTIKNKAFCKLPLALSEFVNKEFLHLIKIDPVGELRIYSDIYGARRGNNFPLDFL